MAHMEHGAETTKGKKGIQNMSRPPKFSDAEILNALSRNNNVRRYAARSLGVSESSLGNRLTRMQRAGFAVPTSGWKPTKPIGKQEGMSSRSPLSALPSPLSVPHSPLNNRPTETESDLRRAKQRKPAQSDQFFDLLPPAGKRLADILEFNSKLAGHPLVDPFERLERREAEQRRIEIHEAWWRTRVEVIDFPAPEEVAPGIVRQTLTVDINQRLSRGEIERIFSLGVGAMHEARGEVAEVFDGVKGRGARVSHYLGRNA
jgi:hypothetical protein